MNKHLIAMTIALLTGTSMMVSPALAAEISPEIPVAITPELLSPAPAHAPAKPAGEAKPVTGSVTGNATEKQEPGTPAQKPAESKPAGNKQDQKAVQQVDDLDDDGEPPHVIRCLDLKGASKIKCFGDKGVRKLGAGVRAAIQQQ